MGLHASPGVIGHYMSRTVGIVGEIFVGVKEHARGEE